MADRNEVIVMLTKDGQTVVDVEHRDPTKCKVMDARMRAAFAFLGMEMKPNGSHDPVRAVPIPELLRQKGGG
ncbi:MAG: hypothetical protein NTX72_04120 [Candidatus Uhrbacteria bacterium]|nr:hypothetical protein [Candidatus Uhrbacteria bacterium]